MSSEIKYLVDNEILNRMIYLVDNDIHIRIKYVVGNEMPNKINAWVMIRCPKK